MRRVAANVAGFATHGRKDDDVTLLERESDGGRRDVHLVVPRLEVVRECKCSFVRAPAHAGTLFRPCATRILRWGWGRGGSRDDGEAGACGDGGEGHPGRDVGALRATVRQGRIAKGGFCRLVGLLRT